MNPALIRQFEQVRDALLAEFPDLADDAPALFDTIDGMDGLQDQLRWLIRQAREREAHAEACKAMAKEITARASRLTAGAERLRDSVKQVMSETGIKRLAAPDFTATLGNGRSHVVITDEHILPIECVLVETRPDKKMIGERLSRGEEIPGALLSNSGMTLTVRVS